MAREPTWLPGIPLVMCSSSHGAGSYPAGSLGRMGTPLHFALAVALYTGYPVAVPGALGIAALFHGDLMQRAPICRARGRRGRWRCNVGGGLAGAGGLLGCQGLLHGLLDQGLQVGGWRGGRRLWNSGLPCGRGLALL